jgi:hypothetical protein
MAFPAAGWCSSPLDFEPIGLSQCYPAASNYKGQLWFSRSARATWLERDDAEDACKASRPVRGAGCAGESYGDTNEMMISPALKLAALCVPLLVAAQGAMALGPNMMVNGGFEGGAQQYTLQPAFSIVHDPANAHTGSWEMRADLHQSDQSAFQNVSCWTNTRYTTSIWYRGSGSVTFEVMGSDGKTALRSATLTATPSWRRATLLWASVTFTSAMIMLADNVGHGTMFLDDVSTGLTDGRTISFDADRPGRSTPTFRLLFDDEFNSPATIDVNNTGASGYHWYTQSFFNPKYNASPSMFSLSGGILTLKDAGTPWSEVLDTAHPADNSHGFTGTVFSGGHGLYAEARIAVVNVASIKNTGWPSWWSFDMKGETKRNQGMPGNPGKTEYIENDFMEYNPTWGSPQDWNSTMHDWGSDGQNLSNANATITPPVGTDYTKYHTYGMLWVPASAENGWNGYRQAYFDGAPEQAVCWIGDQTYKAGIFPATNTSMGSDLFSLMDHDQFQFILGSAQGGTPTMNVDYVRVYGVDSSSMTVVPAGG